MKFKCIIINGRFLEQKLTGVQRYALEIVKGIDNVCKDKKVILAIPSDVELNSIPALKNIIVKKIGKTHGIIWEQFTLSNFIHKEKGLGLHLCNSIPLFASNGIVCIHDITYKINPQFITTKHLKLARAYHCFQYKVAAKKSLAVFTVSEFSKKQIVETYHIPEDKVTVAYNGWQHFSTKIDDESRMSEYQYLRKNKYYFSLATLAKNKNFEWIVHAAEYNPEAIFAIAGSSDLEKLGVSLTANKLSNIHYLGYVSDNDAKLLMKNCKAFLFPSLYEGFGIPPLEALAMGAKVICSNASCLPEIFKDSVYYIDPYNPNVNLDKITKSKINSAESVLNLYNWQESANKIYSKILSILKLGC